MRAQQARRKQKWMKRFERSRILYSIDKQTHAYQRLVNQGQKKPCFAGEHALVF